MTDGSPKTAKDIRRFLTENPTKRARDAADSLGLREAQLVAALCGHGAVRIDAHPDRIIPAAEQLGKVMALTRTGDCVHEKIGEYGNYHSGEHAAMTLTEDIDLRIFPKHWVHAFAVETEGETGPRRSLQIFDAAGDAIHKIHLRDTSHHEVWPDLVQRLALADQGDTQDVADRVPTEAAKSRLDKVDTLRSEWRKLTDTHQFLRLCAKLKMNRLGAYRIAGHALARPLSPDAASQVLQLVRDAGIEIMLFVGNRGCIQIHTGPIHTLTPMGPWQNIMDPGFNLHIRLDRIAEIWAVEKPTQRGPAVSVEAFDADGGLIFQMFGLGKEGRDSRDAWGQIVAQLPTLKEEQLA
ncbi:ChuX/HutX family heme-like substrate-binding protein [Phaeobacter sp.]|uniref:hemin-degrading factor n=1 Tax=Phaeobacter sp. TaxID=1902409 RepID=UPI0025F2D9AC|nr:ChuX/HutX family heme-like substrate-binding protein [Phaeobacter sp.]